MNFLSRIRLALWPGTKHLLASVVVACGIAALVFGVWYPHPYDELAGGRGLFMLLISVDVVCGPLLTLVVYSASKPRKELWRDIGIVVLLQLVALGYGLFSMMQARPVYLAFEGDRFRVVSAPDVDATLLGQAAGKLGQLSFDGPRLVGVRLVETTDPAFPQSIKLSLQGLHPAFRPSRWVDYESQRSQVMAKAKPMEDLKRKRPGSARLIDEAARESGMATETLGYLPLVAENRSDWIVLVGLRDGLPKAYLPIDGW
jgi:hypothetical protein